MTHSFYDGPGLLAAIQVTAALGTTDSMIELRLFEQEASPYGDALTQKRDKFRSPKDRVWELTPTQMS